MQRTINQTLARVARHRLAVMAGALALVLFAAGLAAGGQWRWAGSTQLDYLAVPTNDLPRSTTFDGFTTELSLKAAVDVDDALSAEVKLCYSCHGIEAGLAVADYTFNDQLSMRVGRFTPRFGDFPARHDPANHRTSDKPLPYDMGRMLRLREWNMSVLPAPYVDNGVELVGTHELGESATLEWAAYLIGGLRGSQDATDVDFIQSRSPDWYYVDNNSMPSAGGRIAMSLRGERRSLKFGISGLYGSYDPAGDLPYLLLGVDLVWRMRSFTLRAEYLLRRQEMSLGSSPAQRFVDGPGADGNFDPVAIKDGFYVEAAMPVGPWEFVGRFDGMTRVGNVTASSPLDDRSWILRYTAATTYEVDRHLRWKFSGEFYTFSDFASEVAVHTGVVASF